MAAGDFRFRIPGGEGNEPEIALAGVVHFDVWIERSLGSDPEVWVLIPMGHLTVPISGAQLEQCSTSAEALALIEQEIVDKGLAQAYRARQALIALLPGGTWPEGDVTRVIDVP